MQSDIIGPAGVGIKFIQHGRERLHGSRGFKFTCGTWHWTHLVIVRGQNSYMVYPNMLCIHFKNVKIWVQVVIKFARKQWKKEKHCCNSTLCAFTCIIKHFRWSILLFEWEITSFSKTTFLQREPFLTLVYTIMQLSIIRNQVNCYANNYFE